MTAVTPPPYIIFSACFGHFTQLAPSWVSVTLRCIHPDARVRLLNSNAPREPSEDRVAAVSIDPIPGFKFEQFPTWDIYRLTYGIQLLEEGHTYVHCDLDIMLLKPIDALVNLPYDIIYESEGSAGWPLECSRVTGWGVCTGFSVAKPRALGFCKALLADMMAKKYEGIEGDQWTLMHNIAAAWTPEAWAVTTHVIDGASFRCQTTTFPCGTRFCCLDFDALPRDHARVASFGCHYNKETLKGVPNMKRMFDEGIVI